MDGPALTTGDTISVEEYCARLHRAALSAVTEVGGRIQDSLHERLNVAYPPASAPGESPHRRTGNLAAGVTLNVTEDDQGVLAEVHYTRANGDPSIPAWLEGGTSKMRARPAVVPEYEKWQELAPPAIAELMIQEMTSG
jgi:hypothetical protein